VVQVSEQGVNPDVLDRAMVRVPEHVVFRTFPSETVLLNLSTGNYHGLNATASRMLELLQETGSARTTAAKVADEYGQPVAQVMDDVAQLCADLLDRGLLELAATQPG
jgi:hypothetical protein